MRTVCFDVGGVLIEINHHWKGAMLDAGIEPEIAERFDVPLVTFAPFNAYQKGSIEWDEYCALLGSHLGNVSPSEAGRVHGCILKRPYEGVDELIDDLKARGYRTGCLSNTNAPHWHTFFHEPRLALMNKLDVALASHLLGAEKPDPAMFRAFEEASGACGKDILYFDDGMANVESAARLGWRAYHVDATGMTALQMRSVLVRLGWLD